MPERTIKFSHAYRKLDHPVFTTIRRWTPHKEEYYRSLVGQRLAVQVEGEPVSRGEAVLSLVHRASVRNLPAEFLAYDTQDGLYALSPSMDALVLLFVWAEEVKGC